MFFRAPTYVKFTPARRITVAATLSALILQFVPLYALAPSYGAAGAAIAYGVSSAGLCIAAAMTLIEASGIGFEFRPSQ